MRPVCCGVRLLLEQHLVDDAAHLRDVHRPHRMLRIARLRDEEEGRDAPHAEQGREPLLLVDVDLVDAHASLVLARQRLHDGSHHLAGSAPRGIEVDHCGQVALVFPGRGILLVVVNLLAELRRIQFDCFHGRFVFRFGTVLCRRRHTDQQGHRRCEYRFYTVDGFVFHDAKIALFLTS